MSHLEWKKLSETVVKVGFKKATIKTFQQPNDAIEEYTTWYKPGMSGVAVVALTKEEKVVVARQYRPGPEAVLDELPGGFLDEGEDPAVCAARELKEETGYVTDEPLQFLGKVCRDAYSNGIEHYFLAKNCYVAAEQELDATEFVEIALLSLSEMVHSAKNAKISDANAVYMALDFMRQEKEQEQGGNEESH